MAAAPPASADPPPPLPPPVAPAAPVAPAPPAPAASASAAGGAPTAAKSRSGVAVLALGEERPRASEGATPAETGPNPPAFDLARAVYASDLRPAALDEPHARVLAGEAAAPDALPELRDLASMRSTGRGDDPSSRAVLDAIANGLGLRGIVVVDMLAAPSIAADDAGAPEAPRVPRARLYIAEAHAFDAAQYAAVVDPGGTATDWTTTVQSLRRVMGFRADALAPSPRPVEQTSTKRPFYASPWFWGAALAAVFAGGAIYFATRDNSPNAIHLQLQVNK
jgi:hypothetical protein